MLLWAVEGSRPFAAHHSPSLSTSWQTLRHCLWFAHIVLTRLRREKQRFVHICIINNHCLSLTFRIIGKACVLKSFFAVLFEPNYCLSCYFNNKPKIFAAWARTQENAHQCKNTRIHVFLNSYFQVSFLSIISTLLQNSEYSCPVLVFSLFCLVNSLLLLFCLYRIPEVQTTPLSFSFCLTNKNSF